MSELRLSDQQAKRLAKLKRSSFLRYCKSQGYPPHYLEEFLLQLVKDNLRRVATAGYESCDQYPESLKSQINATDYWTVTDIEHKTRALQIAEVIVKNQNRLQINWDYVKGLADDLKLRFKDKNELIRNIITALPYISIFDVEFNAFVARKSLLDNIPCVCVYELLPTASRGFIDVLCRGMFLFNPDRNGVELKNSSELIKIGRKRWFKKACKTCMEMILGRETTVLLAQRALASLSTPELFVPVRTMTATAHYFAWFHEYGHLLMGHLRQGPCHKVEYEADAFAWRLVEAMASDDPYRGLYMRFGAFSLLLILQLSELIQKKTESESHPTAEKRIISLLRLAKQEDIVYIRRILSSMLTLFQATAEVYYDVQYKIII